MSRSRALRLLSLGAGALALILFARSLLEAVREAGEHAIPFSRGIALASLLTLVVTYLATIFVWRFLMAGFGARLGLRDALRLWSFTNLGRYIPGKVWQVVGIVTLGRPHGVTPVSGGAIAFLTIGLMVGTGMVLGVYSLPDTVPQAGLLRALALVGASILFLPAAFPRLLEGAMRRAPARWRAHEDVRAPDRTALFLAVGAFFGIWMLQGASFYLFVRACAPNVPWSDWPRLTGAYALSYVAGLLAVFAPGGIGVRESLLVLLLEPLGGRGVPVAFVVVGSRFVAILAELLVLLLALGVRPSVRSDAAVGDR